MKNKLLKLSFLLIFVFCLCGCWNYSELNDLAIATALSVDKDGDKYDVSVSIANGTSIQSSSKEGQSQVTVLSGKGVTLADAISKINFNTPKQIYLNHLTAIVISEEVAKKGVNNMVDLLLRDPQSRKQFFLLVSKDTKAKNILKILTPLDARPSQNLAALILNAANTQGVIVPLTYSDFVKDIITEGVNPVLTTIGVDGSVKKGQESENTQQTAPDATIRLGNAVLFREDKMKVIASENESDGINLFLNKANKLVVNSKCKGGNISGNVTNVKAKTKISLKNNKPSVEIKIKGTGSIAEINCKYNLLDEKSIKEINKKLENEVKKLAEKGLKLAQKEKTDVLAFGNLFYHKYPKYYKKVKDKWNDKVFPNIDVKIKVSLDIETKGSLEQTIRQEEKQ